jgi:glycosyltransferase involved in cell wall biosynthesis
MMTSKEPLVSICCITFNHEKYIANTLKGFLMQKTNFAFEIIVHDDASTDHTASIIREYAERYPHMVQTILQSENQYSQGRKPFILTFNQSRGKYIALCEGDDYWVDPDKLQKQIDFLEAHPESVGCFHDCITVDEEGLPQEDYFKGRKYQQQYTQKECLTDLGSSYGTASLVFRSTVVNHCIPKYFEKAGSDFLLDLVITEYGTLNYLPFTGSAYRIHFGGVWQGTPSLDNHLVMLKRLTALMSDETMASRYANELNEMVEKRLELIWKVLRGNDIIFLIRLKEFAFNLNYVSFKERLFLFSRLEAKNLKKKIKGIFFSSNLKSDLPKGRIP